MDTNYLNSDIPTQKLLSNPCLASDVTNFDDHLNDDMLYLMSQAAVRPPDRVFGRNSRPIDTQISTPSQDMEDDIHMNGNDRNGTNGLTYESLEGQNKILQSKLRALTEEVTQLKTQLFYSRKNNHELSESFDKRLNDAQSLSANKEIFLMNEIKVKQHEVERLRHQMSRINKSMPFPSKPVFGKQFPNQRHNCETFSQLKSKEFWAPLVTTQTSCGTQATILAPDSQMSSLSTKRPKMDFNCHSMPSEIPSTQQTHKTNGSSVMDTNDSTTQLTQTSCQEWERIRGLYEIKYNTNNIKLNEYYMDQNMHLFDELSICDKQVLNDWAQCLQQLTDDSVEDIFIEKIIIN